MNNLKVLQVNNYYYIRGGSERYYFYLMDLLESRGHEVISFSTKNIINLASSYEEGFADDFDPDKLASLPLGKKIVTASRMIYSFKAKRKIESLINKTKPTIAHVHNIYGALSPSILNAIKGKRLPIVMTVHDLKLLCPNHRMYVKHALCERCKINKYYNCTVNKCIRNSRYESMVGSIESYVHHLMHIYRNNVDLYITPSEFFRRKLIEYGYPEDKIFTIPNFIQPDDYDPSFNNGKYIIYFGRIEESKGINTLIEAAFELRGQVNFVIVGSGPLESRLVEIIKDRKIENVKIFGQRRRGREINELISDAMFSVMPSQLYENNPYSIYESYACGKPVVASNIGGIPEILYDGKTGLLFKSGDVFDLVSKIKSLLGDPKRLEQMGRNARRLIEEDFGPEKHYEKIASVYEKLIGNKK